MMIATRRQWIAENFLIMPGIALVVAAIAYWAMVVDRQPPIDLSEGRIVPQNAKPGDDITALWRLDRMRKQSCSSVISRYIVDSTNVVWRKVPQQIYDRSYPTSELIGRTIQVPFAAAWGPARYRIEACFRCNGISLTRWFPVCVQEDDLPFEIIPPPKRDQPPA